MAEEPRSDSEMYPGGIDGSNSSPNHLFEPTPFSATHSIFNSRRRLKGRPLAQAPLPQQLRPKSLGMRYGLIQARTHRVILSPAQLQAQSPHAPELGQQIELLPFMRHGQGPFDVLQGGLGQAQLQLGFDQEGQEGGLGAGHGEGRGGAGCFDEA